MREILPGIARFESAHWQTTALLVWRGSVGILVDPCITELEVAGIAAAADAIGVTVAAQLITHSDWDHVCGIASFPDAPAVMSARAGAVVRGDPGGVAFAAAAARWGFGFAGRPRVDEMFEPGRPIQAGPFAVETLPLPGHTACGAGYRLRDPDVLVVGDYLSPVEYPYLDSSATDYRASLDTLIGMLRDDPPALVIPGHGRPLDPDAAIALARSDRHYLDALEHAVFDSLARGDDPVAAGAAVVPPRGADADSAARRRNAEVQLRETRR